MNRKTLREANKFRDQNLEKVESDPSNTWGLALQLLREKQEKQEQERLENLKKEQEEAERLYEEFLETGTKQIEEWVLTKGIRSTVVESGKGATNKAIRTWYGRVSPKCLPLLGQKIYSYCKKQKLKPKIVFKDAVWNEDHTEIIEESQYEIHISW